MSLRGTGIEYGPWARVGRMKLKPTLRKALGDSPPTATGRGQRRFERPEERALV